MANGFSITPASPMTGMNLLFEGISSRTDFERKKTKEAKLQEKRQGMSNIINSGSIDDIQKFMIENPELGPEIDRVYKFKNKATEDNAISTAWSIHTGEKDPSTALIERSEFVLDQGGDPSDSMALAQDAITNPDMTKKEAAILLMRKDTAAWNAYQKSGKTPEAKDTKVGAQEILEDGSIIQSTAKGPVVFNPEGVRVKGKDAAETVARGRAEKVSNMRIAAGEKKTATLEAEQELKGKVEAGVISQKAAAKISVDAYKRLSQIDTNLRNLDEGIGLLRKDGANTGVIDKYLPSLKSATIKMDNLQGRLGLDVLNTTTFGALSAGELKFALDTAVPMGLQPAELADWLEEKKVAQEKLSDYVESAAIFLGTPGNTVKDWIVKQKEKRAQEKTSKGQGPTLQDFLQKAASANPGASEQELTEYYNKKYGGL